MINNCANVSWVIKTDDDIAVDPFEVVHYLNSQDRHKNDYHCFNWKRMRVQRNLKNKWYFLKLLVKRKDHFFLA